MSEQVTQETSSKRISISNLIQGVRASLTGPFVNRDSARASGVQHIDPLTALSGSLGTSKQLPSHLESNTLSKRLSNT